MCARLRASEHVKPSVKEKSHDELLAHCGLARWDLLTNLGVLLVGHGDARASLGSAPIVQAIKYDEREVKVASWSWDDRTKSPIELIDAIWNEVTDFRESYEIPDGVLRTKSPKFPAMETTMASEPTEGFRNHPDCRGFDAGSMWLVAMEPGQN